MKQTNLYKEYNLTIPANGLRYLQHYAKYLAVLENDSDSNVLINIGTGGPRGEIPQGIGIELPEGNFDEILFINETGLAMNIKVALSAGRINDNRLKLIETASFAAILAQLQGDTTEENWGTEKTVGTSAVVAIAANTDRKSASLMAKSTNTVSIFVGYDNTVTSTKWIWELLPGMALSIDNYRGDLYAIATAAGQKLGWGEW